MVGSRAAAAIDNSAEFPLLSGGRCSHRWVDTGGGGVAATSARTRSTRPVAPERAPSSSSSVDGSVPQTLAVSLTSPSVSWSDRAPSREQHRDLAGQAEGPRGTDAPAGPW